MEPKSEPIAELTGKAKRLKNLRPPWKKGEEVKGRGRPLGKRSFDTIYEAALQTLAKKEGTTPQKIENEILAKGVLMSRRGQFNFYKDTMDRRQGQAAQIVKVEVSEEVKKKSALTIATFLNGRNSKDIKF